MRSEDGKCQLLILMTTNVNFVFTYWPMMSVTKLMMMTFYDLLDALPVNTLKLCTACA